MGEVIEKLKGGVSIAPNDYIEDGHRTIPKGAVNDTGVADMSACKNVSVDFFEKNYFSKTSTGELITSLRDLVPSAPNLGRIVRIVGQFEEFIMPQGVYSLKITDNLLEDFLIAYSNNYIYRSVIQSEKNGSTQVHIRNGEFLNIKIQVPSLPEQSAIGTFFSTLDRHITLHQRKLDKLKSVKQAYLSEMFPAEGERVPKRRFPGFTDDWELRKLGELAEIVRGASPRPIQDPKWFDEQSEIGWLRISDVTEQDGRIYHLEQKISKLGQQKTRVLVEPHLLLSIAATVGKPVVNYVKTGVHDGFLIFLEPCFEQEFMFQWLEMFRSYWSKYGQPGSQVNLNSDLVKKQELSIPTLPEQEAIGTFFSTLDRHITLHQRKLEKLKNLKKALLNELFV